MKDHHLSAYNGDMLSPDAAYEHYTHVLGNESCGVMAVSVRECVQSSLSIIEDGIPYLEHITIDFSGLTASDIKRRSQELRGFANGRGWQYRPFTR